MKRYIITASIFLTVCGLASADTTTTRLGLTKPTIGSAGWGPKVNTNYDLIDSSVAVLGSTNSFTAAQTFSNGVSVASITFTGDGTVTTSTNDFVHNTSSLQSGATFYVSSGSVSGQFTAGILVGSGTTITQLNASNLSVGNVPAAQLSNAILNQSAAQASAVFNVSSGTATNFFSNAPTFYSTATFSGPVSAGGVGTSGQVLTSQGNNTAPHWTTQSASAGGSSGQIQYNSAGSLAGLPSVVTASSVTISTPTAILGTQTNSASFAGYYGEVISSTTANSQSVAASGNWGDVVSSTFTAGDWLISGCEFIGVGGATVTDLSMGMSSNPANSSAGLTIGDNELNPPIPTTAQQSSLCIANWHQQFSATTIIYLKIESDYTVGTPNVRGRLNGVRIR